LQLITTSLDEKIYVGIKKRNFLGNLSNSLQASFFSGEQWNFLSIENESSVYINPQKIPIASITDIKRQLADFSKNNNL
jgi:hypothetical protein